MADKQQALISRTLIGIFILSVALIALQVLYTRLFSFTLWHYMAYLVISISMLGLGISGVYISISRKIFTWDKERVFFISVLGFSVSIIIGVMMVSRLQLNILELDQIYTHVKILFFDAVLAVPYIFCGIVLSLAFTSFPNVSGRFMPPT